MMRPSFMHQVIYDDIFTADRNYYRATTTLDTPRPLAGDAHVDVAIVGGGLSGVATAYYLAMRHNLKVAVIERHFVGWGASGRNGGQILPGFMAPLSRTIRRYGFARTKNMWDFSMRGVEAIVHLIDKHHIDCDLQQGASSPILPHYYDAKWLDKELERRHRLGAPLTVYDEARTAAALGCAPGYYTASVCDEQHAWHFHPLKYLQGLKQTLKTSGDVAFFEDTNVIGIDNTGADVMVYTDLGKVFAKRVVLCGDSYLGRLSSRIRRKYVLIRNAMIGTDIIPDNLGVMTGGQCTSEHGGQLLFYRKTGDGRLLIGGGDAVQPNSSFLGTEQRIIDLLKESMVQIFPQLKHIDIPYVWGGYIGVTSNYMPYVGCLDDNVYYMGGYSGHGINQTHGLAQIIAHTVATGDNKTGTAFDALRHLAMPGRGDLDVYLARFGMFMESILERFD